MMMSERTVTHTFTVTLRLVVMGDPAVFPQWIYGWIAEEPQRRPAGMSMTIIAMRCSAEGVEYFSHRFVHAGDLRDLRDEDGHLQELLEYLNVLDEKQYTKYRTRTGDWEREHKCWYWHLTPEELLSRRLLHFGRKGRRGQSNIYAGDDNE